MFTCISCSKQLDDDKDEKHDKNEDDELNSLESNTPRAKLAAKAITSQIRDIAIKACKPCSGPGKYSNSDAASDSSRLQYSYRRAGSSSSTPKPEVESRQQGSSSWEGTPASQSSRIEPVVFVEESEPKEWVAQVEPGVLITFVSLPSGGNDLKRIRFSREIFNKWQAQRWWSENYDKVMELYNVKQCSHQDPPVQTPPRSQDGAKAELESLKKQSPTPSERNRSLASASTVKFSGGKTEASSANGSARSTFSGEPSFSNASEMENEWVEQDEPGVFITIRALADGSRELRRVRFSRERFGETHARVWWDENRARIQQQYL